MGDIKMEKKSRSPRYPNINLQDAIEKVRVIYQKEHIHKANREVIAKDLGYAGVNGASATIISSIKQYGLLESIGDLLKVTDDATIILELSQNDPERIEAVKRAAFAPKLFSEIYDEFGDRLPSDENLRLSLVKRGFNSKAANSVIRAYRETFSIVKNDSRDYNEELNTYEAGQNISNNYSNQNANLNRLLPSKNDLDLRPSGILMSQESFSEDLQYRISDNCKARILFEGEVTQEAITKLIAYLKLGLDDFPSKPKIGQKEIDEQKEIKMLPEVTND
jgi:hypothetical protein